MEPNGLQIHRTGFNSLPLCQKKRNKTMSLLPMMKCGHRANATRARIDGSPVPVCVICAGITVDALLVDENPPELTNRKAICACCDKISDSTKDLAFFEHRPKLPYDLYYCGCKGWN